MLLPSLNAGTMYHLHQGPVQLSDGQILKVEEQSIYFGGGDWTMGSQTVAVPAVHIFGHVGDAYFAPLVAAQVVASRSASSRAIENANLLDITGRYLALVGAEGELYAIRKSEEGLMQVVRATSAFAQTGQGRVGDANRARSQALLLHAQELFAQENLAVASAELSRSLNLDPSVRLRTAAGMIEVIELVDSGYRMEELVSMAQGARLKPRPRPPTFPPPIIGLRPSARDPGSRRFPSASVPAVLGVEEPVAVTVRCFRISAGGPISMYSRSGRLRIWAPATPPCRKGSAARVMRAWRGEDWC